MRSVTYCRPFLVSDERFKANLEKLEKQKLFREALDTQVKEARVLKNNSTVKSEKSLPKRNQKNIAHPYVSANRSSEISSSAQTTSLLLSSPKSTFATTTTSSVRGEPSKEAESAFSPTVMRYNFSYVNGKGQFHLCSGANTTNTVDGEVGRAGCEVTVSTATATPALFSPPFSASCSSPRGGMLLPPSAGEGRDGDGGRSMAGSTFFSPPPVVDSVISGGSLENLLENTENLVNSVILTNAAPPPSVPFQSTTMRSRQASLMPSEGALHSPSFTSHSSWAPLSPPGLDHPSLLADAARANGAGGGGASAAASARHSITGAPKKPHAPILPPLSGGSGVNENHGVASYPVQGRGDSTRRAGNLLSSSYSISLPGAAPNTLLTPLSPAVNTSPEKQPFSAMAPLTHRSENEPSSHSLPFHSSSFPTLQEQALIDEMKVKERSWEEQVNRLKEELRKAHLQQKQQKDSFPRKRILEDGPPLPRSAEVPGMRESRIHAIRRGLRSSPHVERRARGRSRGSQKGGTTSDGEGKEAEGKRNEKGKKAREKSDELWSKRGNKIWDECGAEDNSDAVILSSSTKRRAETAPEGVFLSDWRAKRRSDATMFPNRTKYGHVGRRVPLSPPDPVFLDGKIIDSEGFAAVDSPSSAGRSIEMETYGFRHDEIRKDFYEEEQVGGALATSIVRKEKEGRQKHEEVTEGSKKSSTASKGGVQEEEKHSTQKSTYTREGKKVKRRGSICTADLGSMFLEQLGVDSSLSSVSEDCHSSVAISISDLLQFGEAKIITRQKALELWDFFMKSAVPVHSGTVGGSHEATRLSDDEEQGDAVASENSFHPVVTKGESSGRTSLDEDHRTEVFRNIGTPLAIVAVEELLDADMPSLPPSDGSPSPILESSTSSDGSSGVCDTTLMESTAGTTSSCAVLKGKRTKEHHTNCPSSLSTCFSNLLDLTKPEKDLLPSSLAPEGSSIEISMNTSSEVEVEIPSFVSETVKHSPPAKKEATNTQPEALLHHPSLLNIMSVSLRKKIIDGRPKKCWQNEIDGSVAPSHVPLSRHGNTHLKGSHNKGRKPTMTKSQKEKKRKVSYKMTYLEKLLFASDDDLA